MATELDDIGLSTRAYNCLRRAGYTTIAAVRATSDRDLLDVRNMGVRSLADIREKIGGGSVVDEVTRERWRQDAKWGEQNHPDGTGAKVFQRIAKLAREDCQHHAADGSVTWLHILREEVNEAFAESDPTALRAELIQVAAVAVAWIEAIDRRSGGRPHPSVRSGVINHQGRLEMWVSDPLPGGWVCAEPDDQQPDGVCGEPVESEPCNIHHPGGEG